MTSTLMAFRGFPMVRLMPIVPYGLMLFSGFCFHLSRGVLILPSEIVPHSLLPLRRWRELLHRESRRVHDGIGRRLEQPVAAPAVVTVVAAVDTFSC